MDWSPHINWLEPEAERKNARHVATQLITLQHFEDRFRSADALVSHCYGVIAFLQATRTPVAERGAVADWTNIAGHFAVLAAYHFRDAICSIRQQIDHAPTLRRNVDVEAIDAARERFEREFPDWREMRQFVGHWVDKVYTPDRIEKHSGEDGLVHGVMQGRTLRFTNEGKPISQTVSPEEAEKLRSIKMQVYEAFRKASTR